MVDQMLINHLQEVSFNRVPLDKLSTEDLYSLENKEGLVVVEGNTTKLWLVRDMSIHNILGVNTVMESTNTFAIMDDFGVMIWSGDAESVVEYVKGFFSE
jgi:hypothetical protein